VSDTRVPLDAVLRTCPECGGELWVWSGQAGSLHLIPRHYPENLRRPCWVSGSTWAEAQELVRMRTENGGALLRAAHP
jgi:hypothetical protein